jgi:prepilin-type N-terminal cleavage/methylation domain-containing protein
MISKIGSRLSSQGSGFRVQGSGNAGKQKMLFCTLHPAPCPLKRGFTLIEVLMAISILCIGIVGVLRAYSTSVNAIERTQYNIDAGCLLKAVMGSIEEKAITGKGTSPGESTGELASSSDIKIDATQPGRWQWSEEVRDAGLEAKAPGKASASGEKKPDEEAKYSLNEVKLTVVNHERVPSNKVSVMTYMESAGE